jgi:hypothetical protein
MDWALLLLIGIQAATMRVKNVAAELWLIQVKLTSGDRDKSNSPQRPQRPQRKAKVKQGACESDRFPLD